MHLKIPTSKKIPSAFIYSAILEKTQVINTDNILCETAEAVIFPPVWRFLLKSIQRYEIAREESLCELKENSSN